MSTPNKPQGSTAGSAGRRPLRDNSTTDASTVDLPSSSSPARTSNRNNATTPANSTSRPRNARTPSASAPISARSAVKKPPYGSSAATGVANGAEDASAVQPDDETRAESAAAIDELQQRLRSAEEASDEDKRKIAMLQLKIHDSHDEHTKLEETIQELNGRIDELGNQKRELLRSRKELEALHEVSKASAQRNLEESHQEKEQLLQSIQRLKETRSYKDSPRFSVDEETRPRLPRTSSLRQRGASPHQDASGQFAPLSSVTRSESRSQTRLVHQKDKIIEGLRMELAEAQIKLVELENMGGGQVAELERTLLDIRMTNGRLMEENESFQLLLGEKTMNGDLSQSSMLSPKDDKPAGGLSSLAEELDNADGDDDNTKQYKSQIATLTEENKALLLYINNIISRLLTHEMDFVLDKNDDGAAGRAAAAANKELPPPPPPETGEAMGGLLSRTKTLLGGRKPRPQSMVLPDHGPQTAHENPETAPSIPIGRPQGRSQASNTRRGPVTDWNSAAVVEKMYKGPAPSHASGQLSPGLSSQPAFFAARPGTSSRVTSGSTIPTTIDENDTNEKTLHRPNRDSKISSGRNSIASDTSSPPVSHVGVVDKGSVMVGNRPRPLRLVQENADEEAARKAANRTSWMGWFNKGA